MQYNEISYTEEDIENGVYLTDYTVNPLSVTVLKLVPCEKDANEELKSKLSAVTALAPEKTAADRLTIWQQSRLCITIKCTFPLKLQAVFSVRSYI